LHWLIIYFSTLAVFRVPNFLGHFEALNYVFWGFGVQEIVNGTFFGHSKIILLIYSFPAVYRSPKKEIACKSYTLEKLTYQLPPSGHANLLAFHLPGIRVLDFPYVKKAFGASL
jgi:hypothetical protein